MQKDYDLNHMLWIKCILFIILASNLSAQVKNTEQERTFQEVSEERRSLPFPISESQRISKSDLQNKKEGWYPVFLPVLLHDETLGTTGGATANLIDNGDRKNPLFEYTPYKRALGAVADTSDRGYLFVDVGYNEVYLNDSPWSLYVNAGIIRIPNGIYFGNGTESMKPLSYFPLNQKTFGAVENANFTAYEKNLNYGRLDASGNLVTDQYKNRFEQEYSYGSIKADRLFASLFKFHTELDLGRSIINTYDGKISNSRLWNVPGLMVPMQNGESKLREDAQNGKIVGLNGGYVNSLKVALAIDTRDYALDPTQGIYAEITHTRSMKWIGSDFEYHQNLMQFKGFLQILPSHFEKLVFATRAVVQHSSANTPFFELGNLWSADGYFAGLGGSETLRGFQLSRFIGPTKALGNAELRWKYASANFWDTNFTFHVIPFYDSGRVWDRFQDISSKGYLQSYGIGFQVSVNLSTVFRADFARSREDFTFNFGIGHPF